MLRKKMRNKLIEGSYNIYSFFDDDDHMPDWFIEDESKAYVPNIPVTKEMMAEEKLLIMEYNARPTKKVAEA